MKKKINSLLLLPACLLVFCCGSSDPTDEDDKGGGGTVTVETNYLPIADPYVLVHEGKYYAYGTGATKAFPASLLLI